MSAVLICAGQGAESPGMGLELAARSRQAAELLERAARVTGVDVVAALRRGHPALHRTEVLQPTLTAVALGTARALERAGVRCAAVAGHSAGEVAALAVAGWLDADAAVELARLRGELMAREARAHPGGMLALFVDDEAAVAAAIELGRHRGAVDLAAHNGPDEWVLTGDAAALKSVASAYPSSMLPVSGAWHGPAMAGAVDELRAGLRDRLSRPSEARPRFVSNATAEVVADSDELADAVARQLVRPVRLVAVFRRLRELADAEPAPLVVAGPGRSLRALARRTLGDGVVVHLTEWDEDLAKTIEELAP